MNVQPNLFTKETKLSLTQWAMSQPRNVEHFLEESIYPAIGTWIRVDDKGKGHLRVVCVDKFTEDEGSIKSGYNWYLDFIKSSSDVSKTMQKKNWLRAHNRIFPKVNAAIRNHHGIICCLDGREGLDDDSNTIVLHWCDVLVLALREELGMPRPTVLIKSRNLQSLPAVINTLFFPCDDELPADVTEEEKQFILQNADYYYHMYGLWQNHLNKPIRLENSGIDRMVKSSVFCNDEYFKSHQVGKYNSLKRRVHDDMGKKLYACD